MTNSEDNIGQSPEQFEQWFTDLPSDQQEAWMERVNRLGEARPLDPSKFPDGYIEALIEKYGPIESTASDDFD